MYYALHACEITTITVILNVLAAAATTTEARHSTVQIIPATAAVISREDHINKPRTMS